MLQVRKAEPVDLDDVVASLAQLHFDDHTPFDQDKVLALIESKIVYVAIRASPPGDGAVQGAMILAKEHGSYRISGLAARPGAERGVGTALVEYAIRRCEEEKVPKLWCWSMDLYNVKGFYQKLGFTEAYLLKKQFFGGRDCWFLGRLTEPERGEP